MAGDAHGAVGGRRQLSRSSEYRRAIPASAGIGVELGDHRATLRGGCELLHLRGVESRDESVLTHFLGVLVQRDRYRAQSSQERCLPDQQIAHQAQPINRVALLQYSLPVFQG